jgi:hypothetical protein
VLRAMKAAAIVALCLVAAVTQVCTVRALRPPEFSALAFPATLACCDSPPPFFLMATALTCSLHPLRV